MKLKRLLATLLCATLISTNLSYITLAEEEVPIEPAHEHSYTYTDKEDGTHDKICECMEDVENEAHAFDEGVCVCGEEQTSDPSGDKEEETVEGDTNSATDPDKTEEKDTVVDENDQNQKKDDVKPADDSGKDKQDVAEEKLDEGKKGETEKTNSTDKSTEEKKEEIDADESKDKEAEDKDAKKDAEEEKQVEFKHTETVEGYKVSLEAKEGVFPEGTTVKIVKVSEQRNSEIEEIVEEQISDEQSITKVVAFDITFYDKDMKEIEPVEGSVSVSISLAEEVKEAVAEAEEPVVEIFHIDEEDKVEMVLQMFQKKRLNLKLKSLLSM